MSNDKAAATWHPDAAQAVHVAADGTETPFYTFTVPAERVCEGCQATEGEMLPDVEGGWVCATCADDVPDAVEPITLADLRDLIGETAEALDTLVERAQALRNDNRDIPEGDDLAAAVGLLAASWANARVAQTEVARLATVLPS